MIPFHHTYRIMPLDSTCFYVNDCHWRASSPTNWCEYFPVVRFQHLRISKVDWWPCFINCVPNLFCRLSFQKYGVLKCVCVSPTCSTGFFFPYRYSTILYLKNNSIKTYVFPCQWKFVAMGNRFLLTAKAIFWYIFQCAENLRSILFRKSLLQNMKTFLRTCMKKTSWHPVKFILCK